MRQLTSTRNGRLEEPPRPVPFLRSWISDQRRLLQELVALSGGHVDSGSLQRLVERVTSHYELYYKSKSTWAKRHVTSMFWVGGWRPSLALQLLHSKSAIQTRAEVVVVGDLSQSQRSRLEAMQREVDVEEMGITDTLNAIRESTVGLAHDVSEMMWAGLAVDQRMVTAHLAHKEARQFRVLQAADELRMRTIKKLLEILTPIQCVHFLIAMAELQLRVHEWGQLRDTIIQARDVFGGGDGRALEA